MFFGSFHANKIMDLVCLAGDGLFRCSFPVPCVLGHSRVSVIKVAYTINQLGCRLLEGGSTYQGRTDLYTTTFLVLR